MDDPPLACRLGYEEDDGDAYCFVHFGFAPVAARVRVCDLRPTPEGAC